MTRVPVLPALFAVIENVLSHQLILRECYSLSSMLSEQVAVLYVTFYTALRCAVGTRYKTMTSMLNEVGEAKDAQGKSAMLDSAQGLKAAGNKAFAAGDLDQAFAVSAIQNTLYKEQLSFARRQTILLLPAMLFSAWVAPPVSLAD